MMTLIIVLGAMNVVFEAVLISMLPIRSRLRLLGSENACNAVHFLILLTNLVIHWGTVSGTSAAVFSFCCSLITVRLLRIVNGTINNGRYRRGIIAYKREELI